jgi:hypothetical protein
MFHLNLTRIRGTLLEDQRAFMIISRSVLLRVRNVSEKHCREHPNKHFMVNNFLFEHRAAYVTWKQPDMSR